MTGPTHEGKNPPKGTRLPRYLPAIAALGLLLLVLVLASPAIGDPLHAATQAVYGGNSYAKMMGFFGFFIGSALLSIGFWFLGPRRALARLEKPLFAVLVAASVAGFVTGVAMLSTATVTFGSLGPYATIYGESGALNWEASSLEHNHFPKLAVFALTHALGLDLGSGLDDGEPFYRVFPDANAWAGILIAIMLAVVVSGFIHINARVSELHWLDWLAFHAFFVGLVINILDGGAGHDALAFTLFFGALYLCRRYLDVKPEIRDALPLALAGAATGLFTVLFALGAPGERYVAAMLVVMAAVYYLGASIVRKKTNVPIAAVMALLLVISAPHAFGALDEFGNGRTLQNHGLVRPLYDVYDGDGLLAYGLPESATDEQVRAVFAEFGSVLEFDRSGWVAYARIMPYVGLQSGSVERRMREAFPSQTYLYVEPNKPVPRKIAYKVHWLDGQEHDGLLDANFLGITVTGTEEHADAKRPYTIMYVNAQTEQTWQMLSILTALRERGLEGRVLLSRHG